MQFSTNEDWIFLILFDETNLYFVLSEQETVFWNRRRQEVNTQLNVNKVLFNKKRRCLQDWLHSLKEVLSGYCSLEVHVLKVFGTVSFKYS